MMMTLIITLFSSALLWTNTGIYGVDNRQEVMNVTNPVYLQAAQATAAQISKEVLVNFDEDYLVNAEEMGRGFCKDEPFREQPAAATCTGTLVKKNLILTAGHCYQNKEADCAEMVWAFDYKSTQVGQTEYLLKRDNVYHCKKVVKHSFQDGKPEYALIELDRPVEDRTPITLGSKKDFALGVPLFMVGHPWGLPAKVADDAFLLKTNKTGGFTNLDSYEGNSGGGIFHALSGQLIGYFISGLEDRGINRGCFASVVRPMDKGEESVLRLDHIRKAIENFGKKTLWPF